MDKHLQVIEISTQQFKYLTKQLSIFTYVISQQVESKNNLQFYTTMIKLINGQRSWDGIRQRHGDNGMKTTDIHNLSRATKESRHGTGCCYLSPMLFGSPAFFMGLRLCRNQKQSGVPTQVIRLGVNACMAVRIVMLKRYGKGLICRKNCHFTSQNLTR